MKKSVAILLTCSSFASSRCKGKDDRFASNFNHKRKSAHPGYYQVYLERDGINVELTSTLRTGYHR